MIGWISYNFHVSQNILLSFFPQPFESVNLLLAQVEAGMGRVRPTGCPRLPGSCWLLSQQRLAVRQNASLCNLKSQVLVSHVTCVLVLLVCYLPVLHSQRCGAATVFSVDCTCRSEDALSPLTVRNLVARHRSATPLLAESQHWGSLPTLLPLPGRWAAASPPS